MNEKEKNNKCDRFNFKSQYIFKRETLNSKYYCLLYEKTYDENL